METGCLFCGAARGGPGHHCNGKQGHVEADINGDRATGQEVWTPRLPQHADELNPALAQQLSDAGCTQSGDRAAEDWKQDMLHGIYVIARRQPRLTSDDLWAEMGAAAVAQCNPSALGSVFKMAAKDGLIRLTGERQESQRPAHHRKPLRVWQSLVYALSTGFPQGGRQ